MSRRPDSAAFDRPDGTLPRPATPRVQPRTPGLARKPADRVASPAYEGRTDLRDLAVVQLVRTRTGQSDRSCKGTAQWGRHRLAADSVEALRLVGAFGTVDAGDLAGTFRSARRLQQVVADLRRAGLLRVERFRRGRRVVDAASLTGAGKRLLERSVDPRERGDEGAQRYRTGPARRTQVLHDTAIFRAALREAKAIEALGGQVRRIRTGDDLQRLAWRRMESARRGGASRDDAQSAAAASLQLSLCDAKLTFPDVRIEYESQVPEPGSNGTGFVDVEVATPDYRESSLRAKTAAGFRIYTMNPDGSLRSDAPPIGSNRV